MANDSSSLTDKMYERLSRSNAYKWAAINKKDVYLAGGFFIGTLCFVLLIVCNNFIINGIDGDYGDVVDNLYKEMTLLETGLTILLMSD